MLAPLLLAMAAPVPATSPADASVTAAVAVVRNYYRAIDRHHYRTAHAIWSGGRGFAAFRRGYAQTAHVSVTPLPPFTSEGAAGSVYARIRVVVNAVLIDRERQRFRGSYTLRRVNDVDGSTAAARHWHIESAHLRRVPASG